MISAERLSGLLLRLYEGASTPGGMKAFLAELNQLLGASGAHYWENHFKVHEGLQIQGSPFFQAEGYSEEQIRVYLTRFHAERDVYLRRALDMDYRWDCGVSTALISDKELQRTEFYADFLRPFDLRSNIWIKVTEDANSYSSLSIMRSLSAPHFGEEELKLLIAVTPHVRQASILVRSLHALRMANVMLNQAVGGAGISISLVRRDGGVLRSTAGAEEIFRKAAGLSLCNGRLKLVEHRWQRTLDELIVSACQLATFSRNKKSRNLDHAVRTSAITTGSQTLRSWTAPYGGTMLIYRKPPLGPLVITVTPFCPGPLLPESDAAAIVQFSDPESVPRSRSDILGALYKLTPTERRLADLLLARNDVSEVAARMGNTIETTRYNLKRVLAKTGARRQSELIRLMLSLPGTSGLIR